MRREFRLDMDLGMDPDRDCPSLERELEMDTKSSIDYAKRLKDYTHDQMVELIAQMDMSAKKVCRIHEHNTKWKDAKILNQASYIHKLEEETHRVKESIRFLCEYAGVGVDTDGE